MGAWWSYRVRRRTAGPLAVCVLLLTSGVLGSFPAAAVAPRGGPTPAPSGGRVIALRVLQMNLCNSGAARCYTGRSVAEAAAVIRAEAPDAVTLNEVCADDVPVLERALSDGGGSTVSAFRPVGDRRTGAVVRCRTGQPYGIGLVVRRPVAGGHGSAYTATGGVYPVQPTRGPEQRAWLCLRPTGPAGPGAAVVCTTHLSSGNPFVAGAQCAYLLGTALPAVRAQQVRALGGSAPLVLAGDLNLMTGGSPGVGSCVPAGDRRTDDGGVQYVVATSEFAVGSRRTIGLTATDHPGLLVTLTAAPGPAVVAAGPVSASD